MFMNTPPLRLLFGHVAPLVYEVLQVMSLRVVKGVVKAPDLPLANRQSNILNTHFCSLGWAI